MAADVVPFPQQDRNLAVLYARVRDAARMTDASQAERIAVLELVKAEIVRECQQEIDDGYTPG